MLLTMSQCFAMWLDIVCAFLVIVVAFGALILEERKYRYVYHICAMIITSRCINSY